jgi:DNA-binding MarR family transcriptional regulator
MTVSLSHVRNFLCLFLRVRHQIVSRFEEEMTRRGHKGLTVRLFSSLSMIEDGMNPAELARLRGVTKQAMSQTLTALSDARLIRQMSDRHDGRIQLLTVTEKGKQALADGLEAMQVLLDPAGAIADEAFYRQLTGILEELGN